MLSRSRLLRWLGLSTCALGLTLIAPRALAQPALRAQVTQRGDFVLLGNTLAYDCAPGTPAPVVGVVGACGTNTADSAPDVFWRADAPALGQAQADSTVTVSQARSTAMLALPAGATVTRAFVYWGAQLTTPAIDSTATLDRPGPGGFTASIGALQSWTNAGNTYQSVADVTALVQTNGAGAYRMGDVDVRGVVDLNEANVFAGWWMVVLFEAASYPLRTISVLDGFDAISASVSQNVTVSGFLVPSSGFSGRLGIAAFEGDNTLPGDQLVFNGMVLADAQNPPNNFFNGTHSFLGLARSMAGDLPQLTGTAQSSSGVDLDVVDVTGLLTPGQTSASVSASSTGDAFFLAGLVTSISTFQPDLGSSTKTATDLDGGDLIPGDQVEYRITVGNTGNDTAVATVLTDVLTPGVTFVPGSLAIAAGPNAGPQTDAAGDDPAEYDAATRTVRFRIGAGAGGVVGGSLPIGATSTVVFRVTIDAGVSGNIVNQGSVSAAGLLGSPSTATPTDGNGAGPGSPPTILVVEACSTDASCGAPSPRCDVTSSPHVCVACLTDGDCTTATPTCVARACTCVPSGAETCNGLDDDCNGAIDDGNPGGGVACATGRAGVCDAGLTSCASGVIACVPGIAPGAVSEVCNAMDDDCDGVVDEGFDVGVACSAGIGACTRSGTIACNVALASACAAVAGAPTSEVCGDGVDDDCDGTPDDGCAPDAGVPDASATDAGSLTDGAAPDGGARDGGAQDGGARDGASMDDGGTAAGSGNGGCACRVSRGADARGTSLLLAALGLVALVRRGRRMRA